MKSREPIVDSKDSCTTGLPTCMLSTRGMDYQFLISHFLRHFIPALVLLEGLFRHSNSGRAWVRTSARKHKESQGSNHSA